MFHLRNIGGMYSMVVVDCDISDKHKAGGISYFWDKSLEMDITGKSLNHIDIIITNAFGSSIRGATHSNVKYLACDLTTKLENEGSNPNFLCLEI